MHVRTYVHGVLCSDGYILAIPWIITRSYTHPTQVHLQTLSCTHIRACTHTHIHINTHTHTCVHMHAHMHVHTHAAYWCANLASLISYMNACKVYMYV